MIFTSATYIWECQSGDLHLAPNLQQKHRPLSCCQTFPTLLRDGVVTSIPSPSCSPALDVGLLLQSTLTILYNATYLRRWEFYLLRPILSST